MGRFGRYLHNLWHVLHREHDDCEPAVSDISLQRQLLYDAFANPESIAAKLEMPGISPDGAEAEYAAHRARLERLVPIMPLLLGQAGFLSSVAANIHIENSDVELDETMVEAVHHVFDNIVKASVVASVSTAVALGALEINKEVVVDEL